MYYMGIDQSYTSTGMVLIDPRGNMVNHNVVSSLKADGDYFNRAKIVAEMITSQAQTNIEFISDEIEIALEGLAFGMRGHTLQNLAGLQFMIVNNLREIGVNPHVHTPSTVKKFATGSGKAKKDDMWNSLPENIKKVFGSISKAHGREDLCDAYWIAMKTRGESK